MTGTKTQSPKTRPEAPKEVSLPYYFLLLNEQTYDSVIGSSSFYLKDIQKILFPVSERGVGSRDSFRPMSPEQKCDFWLLGSITWLPVRDTQRILSFRLQVAEQHSRWHRSLSGPRARTPGAEPGWCWTGVEQEQKGTWVVTSH